MNNTSTIGFIQIEIQNSEIFTLCKVSHGIEKMFEINSIDYIGKTVEDCYSYESNFSSFLLKELENSYKNLISHSESFNFETSFVDPSLQQKYLCHLTLHPYNEDSTQLFDITVINVSYQNKNIFILEEILERTSTVFGQEFFDSVVMLFHDFFGVTASYIGFFKENNTKNLLYSFAKNGQISNHIETELRGSACELVLQQGEVTIESEVEKLVPYTANEITFKREAFIGQPITNSNGEYVGLIGIQHETKIQDSSLIRSILRILAPRTFAEYSRLSAHTILIDKNKYYQYILENVSSPIIATNSKGIIQNVTNSIVQLLGINRPDIIGKSLGAIFSLEKQQFEQSFFFKILIANIQTPIIAKVVTKNPLISELIFETKEFEIESGKKEYIFTISEKNNNNNATNELKDLEYFVHEAKVLELRTILLELQQSQTKNPLENIDICLQTVSKALSVEYSGYWSTIENGLQCERFYEVLESKFNTYLEGFTLNDHEYGEYLEYFRSLKEPSIIYDVYTNPITQVFKNYFIQFGIEIMVEIPIWINGELKGMFCVEAKDSKRRFEEYEISFLSAVSLIISQGLYQTSVTSSFPSQEKFHEKILLAFHSLDIPLIVLDTKTLNIIDVNESWANTFNFYKQAIIGLTLNEINFFKNIDRIQQANDEAMFLSEVALKQHSYSYIDHSNTKREFLVTSTLFSVNDSLVSLFWFHPVQKDQLSISMNDFNEQSLVTISSNELEIQSDTLETLSQKIITPFSSLIEEKNLSFSVYIDEQINNCTVIEAEKVTTLARVLVENSVKYTSKGFVSLSFVKKIQSEGNELVTIEVKDSGSGMDEEQVTTIINSFSHPTSQNNGGLATVRDIVSSLKGTISIDSILNRGTTMIVEIPLVSILFVVENQNSENNQQTTFHVEDNIFNIKDKMFLIQRSLSLTSTNIEQLLVQFGALHYFSNSIQETKEVAEFIQFDCIVLFLEHWNDEDVAQLKLLQGQTINTDTPIIVVSDSTNVVTSSMESVAIEILSYSNSFEGFIETLGILFPVDEVEQVEKVD